MARVDMSAREGQMPRVRLSRSVKGVSGVALAIGIWEATHTFGVISPGVLPPFPEVLGSMVSGFTGGPLLAAVGGTIRPWALGLLLASLIGVVGGIVLGLSPTVEKATRPFLEFIRPIPSVALIPIALLVLGIGATMEIGLIAFASIWPVLFNTKAGVEGTEPRYLDVGYVVGLPKQRSIRSIILPAASPAAATGIRTAASIALILAVTVELVTGQSGLGEYLQSARLAGQADQTWAAILTAGLLGYLINVLFTHMERRVNFWSEEWRQANVR